MKKSLNETLRDADPLLSEPGLSGAEVARIRHAVLNAPRRRPVATWSGTLVLASAAAVTAAILFDRRAEPAAAPAGADAGAATAISAAGERRQLLFAAPGGTRVIWVFDSAFDVK